jgi:hypothetical protein
MEWLLAFVASISIVFIIFIIIAIKILLNDHIGKTNADIIYCVIYVIIVLTVFIRIIFL